MLSLQDLVKEAERVYHKRETEEVKRKWEKRETEEIEDRWDKRQEKSLTRILAAVLGDRETYRTEQKKRQGTWAMQGQGWEELGTLEDFYDSL